MKKLLLILLLFPLGFALGQEEILDVANPDLIKFKPSFVGKDNNEDFMIFLIKTLNENNKLVNILNENYHHLSNDVLSFIIDYKGKIKNIDLYKESSNSEQFNLIIADLKVELLKSLKGLPSIKPARDENGNTVNYIVFLPLEKFLDKPRFYDFGEYEDEIDAVVEEPLNYEEEVLINVEEMPVFGNCDSVPRYALYYCSYENINNYLTAEVSKLNYSTKGKVYVGFVVDENGKVVNIKVEKGVNQELDNLAIELIGNLVNWQAGKQRGIPVKVSLLVPVNFQ